jgi:sodium transport system permease protein
MAARRERRLADTVYTYGVTGARAEEARRVLAAVRAEREKTPEGFRFKDAGPADPARALEAQEIFFYIEATTAAEATARLRDALASRPGSAPGAGNSDAASDARRVSALPPDVTVLTLVFRGDRDDSEEGARRLRQTLADARRAERGLVLARRGFPIDAKEVAPVESASLASAGQVAGLWLSRLLTPLLLMFLFTGGAVVAIDTLAGEKERGTLETLLTTAAGRAEIVAAKHLLILAVGLVITLIQVTNLVVYVGFRVVPAGASFSAAVPPPIALLLLLLFLPVAALGASVLLLVSGYAKSYKEAQLYFFPVFLLGMLPGLAGLLPGLSLRSAIVLVPIANVSVAVKEILVGSIDWPFVAITWIVTTAAALWAGRAVARSLSTERLIVPAHVEAAELLGGPALFPRHVARWFMMLWAATLIVALNTEGRIDIRVQLLVNLIGILLGGSALMIRRYRLPVREALALRSVKPAVWIAVAAGAPVGILTGIGVFRLANLIVPVSDRVIESFSQYLVPQDIPFWQILPMMTVLPGICEEIAFRGLLLHGLHRRLPPAAVSLVVGLAFGLFHMSLFRLAPTAYLGVLFAAATLITGSIFPAMVWHALNNGISLVAAHYGISLADLEPGTYLAATAILAASFWIMWRNRQPYPGLRPWRRVSVAHGFSH